MSFLPCRAMGESPAVRCCQLLSGFSDFLLLGLLAREVLEALADDVAIQRVQLHQEGFAAGLLGGDEGRAAATKEVEDMLAAARGVLDGTGGQLDGLFR